MAQALANVDDGLADDVHLVNFTMNGDFISTSSDGADDTAFMPIYWPIDGIPKEHRTDRVISRKDLVELDRLGRCVDLVTYKSQPGSRAVFKYQFQSDSAQGIWHELNSLLRLREHPKIVPVGRLVTDFQDVPGHGADIQVVVGFTSTFLKYLEQLLQVVDDLNLKFGIVHQEIYPQNIIIDPTTDTLQLFDFGDSGWLGWGDDKGHSIIFTNTGTFESDVIGIVVTVYEVITGDTERAFQLRTGEEDISTINRREWVKHPNVSFDSDVSSYRRALQRWLRWRKRPHNLITHFSQAQSPLQWPQPWQPVIQPLNDDGSPIPGLGPRRTRSLSRKDLRASGLKYVAWERPAHNKIPEGFRVLGDGTLVAQADLDRDAQGQALGPDCAESQTSMSPSSGSGSPG